jgi:hypothetical protein
MSEIPRNIGEQGEIKEEREAFCLPIKIGKLDYSFEGEIIKQPGSLKWLVRIPDWQQQLQMPLDESDAGWADALREFENSCGEIASLRMEMAKDYLRLIKIESKTQILPKGSQYKNARGVAGFLFSNSLTFADSLNLPVFLEPYPNVQSTINWAHRHGFDWRYKHPEEDKISQDYGSMVRPPHSTEENKEIQQFLEKGMRQN